MQDSKLTTLTQEAPNFARVTFGPLIIWYSYATPIGFMGTQGRVVRENDWGPTTGKHLNRIDGGSPEQKKLRLTGAEFERELGKALAQAMANEAASQERARL